MQRPDLYDASHRGGGSEPPDPGERLKQLQTELDQHNDRINRLTTQRDALNNDIKDLSTSVAAVKTTVTNYGTALADLESRLHALQYFYEQKSKMVLAAIGDKKGPIDDLIRDFDHEIERMQDKLNQLGERQEEAQEESDEAARDQKARQDKYDRANNYQTLTTGKLTDMEGLRGDITKADDNSDVASMYLLVLEFHGELRETHVISQHQLSLELRQALAELEAAKEHARAKAAALSAVQAEYSAHQKALDDKRTSRRAKLLAAVQAMFPAPPASSTSGSSSSAASGGAASSTSTSGTAPAKK
jgi:septal ring factor EnvC (AmiA/AmiB activator)